MRLEKYLVNEAGMTINQLRNTEQYNDFTTSQQKQLEEVMLKLRKDCAPFLKELKKSGDTPLFLYRNMNVDGSVGKRQVRKDRDPRDTSRVVHKIFDDVLEDLFGFRGRSSALFCSGNEDWGGGYGASYMIFPIGKFRFIWSPKIKDSYDVVGNSAIEQEMITSSKKELDRMWDKKYSEGGKGHWYFGQFKADVDSRLKTKKDAIKNIYIRSIRK